MGFNYGLEKKNFDRQWAIMRKQYEDAGMSIEVIQSLSQIQEQLSWRSEPLTNRSIQMLFCFCEGWPGLLCYSLRRPRCIDYGI